VALAASSSIKAKSSGRVIGEIDQHFVMTVFEHVMEDRAAPVLRRVALAGWSILEGIGLVGFGIVQRNPRPSKIGCSVSMKTIARDKSRPLARQRSQKPRTRSFSGRPVRPWLTSQFISCNRGATSMTLLCRAITFGERLARNALPTISFGQPFRRPLSRSWRRDGRADRVRPPTAGTA